jgi:hypothetical protein
LNAPNPVKCPNCPVCGRPPQFAWAMIKPWFCQNDDCNVLAWDPDSTLEENLMDASPVRHFINGVEQPLGTDLHEGR